jgi:hypothetical protein
MKSGIINPIGDGFQGKYRYEERYEERWESGIPSVSQIPSVSHFGRKTYLLGARRTLT